MTRHGGLDATWRALLPELPRALRATAEGLPWRLGLTASPDEGWEHFVTLAPNRDLPRFVTDVLPEHALPRVEACTTAHHLAAFHGLVSDRLTDRQVPSAPELRALRDALLARWARELGDATGAPAEARRAIASALWDCRKGVAEERRALASRSLDPRRYAALVRLKLRWITASAACLLQTSGRAREALALERTYGTFLLSCQCRDDALDALEDQALSGASFPSVVGLPAGGFFRAGYHLARRAADDARHHGFRALADWLASHADATDLRPPGDHPLQDDLAGLLLASADTP